MRSQATVDEELGLPHAFEHSWQWFHIHAQQRMSLINYFLVAAAFLVAAYATGLQANTPGVSVGAALFGTLVTACFQRIEMRTRELIVLGEDALEEIQQKMAITTGIDQLQFIRNAETVKSRFSSYRIVIRALHLSTVVMFLLGTLYALSKF